MTIDEAIHLIKIERECVDRNNQPFGFNCDRECGKCDLLQNTNTLIEMYDDVAEWLEELKKLRVINSDIAKLSRRKLDYDCGYNKAVDECIAKIDTLEQIAFGVVDTDLVRSMLEQLKAGGKNDK